MTIVHKAICDRCGLIEDAADVETYRRWVRPYNWNMFEDLDYCPDCFKLIRQKIDEALKK